MEGKDVCNMNSGEKYQMEFDLASTYEEKASWDGYGAWQAEQREKYARVIETWHLPIHKHVCVKLKWMPEEFEGVLVLREFPENFSSKFPLKLRVASWDFESAEIEYCRQANRDNKSFERSLD